jgi:phosphoglycerate dehydrogenase-like enzyme
MGPELVVYCNLLLPADAHALLREGVGDHRLVEAEDKPEGNSPLGRPEPRLGRGDVDVVFGQPEAAQCAPLARLRWVHLSSAGYTSFDEPPIRSAFAARGAALTTSSGVYDEPCAQHALALLLAHARQLPRSVGHQLGDRAWAAKATRAASRLLGPGDTVLLVGFGAIARRIAELLAPFGANVIGVRRRPTGAEPARVVGWDRLDGILPAADFVVDVLPANAGSRGAFDARRFALMKPGAVFVNIGRGTTVDQDALLAALRGGHLAAAYLDVTQPEPLPPDHPLWSEPRCVITPHCAGGHHDEHARLVRHFVANLRRFERGEPLADRVI